VEQGLPDEQLEHVLSSSLYYQSHQSTSSSTNCHLLSQSDVTSEFALPIFHLLNSYVTTAGARRSSILIDAKSGKMSKTCFWLMKVRLKFNICNLETPHLLNRDVNDLSERIAAKVKHCILADFGQPTLETYQLTKPTIPL
jgi:hypothetical protein